jgi:hypothetical protein
MDSKKVIGIMGPGENATKSDLTIAFELGKLIARTGNVLLTGGRSCGVMEAAMKGAKEESGITIGILPGNDRREMSSYVDIPIITGMGNARNSINILSSQIIIAVGIGAGTLSEVALAIKSNKPVIWYNYTAEAYHFFYELQSKTIIFMDNLSLPESEQLINNLLKH